MGKESKESKLGIIVMHKVFENPGGGVGGGGFLS
jgi:hypothetical protein